MRTCLLFALYCGVLKEYLAHRLFKSVEQLESLLHKLLNEGDLIIEWDRKLKNKGNAVIAI